MSPSRLPVLKGCGFDEQKVAAMSSSDKAGPGIQSFLSVVQRQRGRHTGARDILHVVMLLWVSPPTRLHIHPDG